jgi:hypothetical protein
MAEALAALSVELGKTALDATRTNVGITINNQHPEVKLEYTTRFIHGGECINPPANEIGLKASETIQLKANTIKFQFRGILLYKLIPNRSEITMTNSIYLVLAWKAHVYKGLHAYMTLIEHDDDSVSLERDAVEKHYYHIFRHTPQKPNRAIRCSWFLDECIPFTISMTAGNSRFGKINVEVKKDKSERSVSRPM